MSGQDVFDGAVRKMFGVGPDHRVEVVIEGGGERQIGDRTWEDAPTEIIVRVFPPGENGVSHTFDTIPELWAALEGSRS